MLNDAVGVFIENSVELLIGEVLEHLILGMVHQRKHREVIGLQSREEFLALLSAVCGDYLEKAVEWSDGMVVSQAYSVSVVVEGILISGHGL
jgi:hypothetical protein